MRAEMINRCPRCAGLLAPERISCYLAQALYGFECWRCLNCGNRLDVEILKNRRRMRERLTSTALVPPRKYPQCLLTC